MKLRHFYLACYVLLIASCHSFAQQWQFLGLGGESISAIAVDPKNMNIIYAGSASDFSAGKRGGLFKSTNAGATWDTLLTGLSVNEILIHPDNPSALFVASGTENESPPGILKSTNAGISWAWSDSGIVLGSSGASVPALAIDPRQPDIMYAVTGGFFGGSLYKTVDGGRFWFRPGIVNDNNIGEISINPQQPETLYCGTSGYGAVFVSRDAGITWDSTLWNVGSVGKMALDVFEPQRIYALISFQAGGPLARTTDGGLTWLRSRIIDSTVHGAHSIVINPRSTNEVYLTATSVTQRGVYRSRDYGNTWSLMNEGIESLSPFTLAIDSMKDRLYLGIRTADSNSGGVYVSGIVTAVERSDHKLDFRLSQTYPNPFNSTTSIGFSMIKGGHVLLRIYNMLGQTVAVLLNNWQEPGEHQVTFDASRLPSGVYFYRLQAGAFVQNKTYGPVGKMLLMK